MFTGKTPFHISLKTHRRLLAKTDGRVAKDWNPSGENLVVGQFGL